jgi:hypothetical protein
MEVWVAIAISAAPLSVGVPHPVIAGFHLVYRLKILKPYNAALNPGWAGVA